VEPDAGVPTEAAAVFEAVVAQLGAAPASAGVVQAPTGAGVFEEPPTGSAWDPTEDLDAAAGQTEIVPFILPTKEISLPSLATTVLLADRLDPLSADVYNLAFTCILLPRFPSHYLSGDLAAHLSRWFPQICLAYGWRLEGLAIRPDHIQWVIRIPPTTSPATLLKVIRLQTSQRVFDNFPRLKEENASGEFWAPSYLILSGVQTIAAELLHEFIRQTRLRQGIKKTVESG